MSFLSVYSLWSGNGGTGACRRRGRQRLCMIADGRGANEASRLCLSALIWRIKMEHIVRFDEWCKDCKHYDTDETEDPCDECLRCPLNWDSRQPVMFEEEGQD